MDQIFESTHNAQYDMASGKRGTNKNTVPGCEMLQDLTTFAKANENAWPVDGVAGSLGQLLRVNSKLG